MTVSQIMTSPIVTVSHHASLADAARLLWDRDCGILPVVEVRGRLVGVVTDRDICMSAWSHGQPLHRLRVCDAMARHVFAVRPDDDLQRVELLMVTHQIRRVPVVDHDHQPIGIITLTDVARAIARSASIPHDDAWHALQMLLAIAQPRRRSAAA